MPGTRWINLLVQQDCRVEVSSLINLHNSDQFQIGFSTYRSMFFYVSDMHREENNIIC